MQNKILKHLFLLLCLVIVSEGCRQSQSAPLYDIHKSASGSKGMVVTGHPLASEVGLKILKKGGNAADAAIAVQFALAVVYPRAGNIGGGGFLVYRDKSGKILTLDYREKAPINAHRDMYLDSLGNVIPGLSLMGILSVGVPGTVAGLVATHKKLGKLQWSDLVEPAIHLAKKGFRLTASEATRLNDYKDIFLKYNPPSMPFISEKPWEPGDLLIQKELASTLQLIADHGNDGFYSGQNADTLLATIQTHKGLITQEDLSLYIPIWRRPLTIQWRGYEIHTMGSPSSGGIVLGQILKMIDGKLVDSIGHRHPQNIHLIVEAERRAYADRARYLGDAEFCPVPVDSIMSRAYLMERFKDFDPAKASVSGTLDSVVYEFSEESFETTHLSIADSEGNAASVTTTLNDNYGSKVWVPGGGYFLNNEMDDFSSKPGVPNLYGLIGAEANAIEPTKRMLSSMTPTIVEKYGKLWMVVGTPGGSTIITSVLQVLLHSAVFGMNIDEAVQEPRFHHQWLPDEIIYEKDAFSPELIKTLTSMGYSLNPIEALGLIEAIMVDEKGVFHGAADRRGDDHASGF